jgi:hypothetical protein
VATGKKAAGLENVVSFPDLAPKGSNRGGGKRALLGEEIGTQFDWGQRLFAYYGEGDVFDYGEWSSRDMKVMFSRDGISAALGSALTLPIRQAARSISGGKGDKGEAEFVNSVLSTPDSEGGMRTPMSEVIGQITSAQFYRRAFFEKTFKIRDSDEKVVYDKIAYRPPSTCQARYNDRSGEPNGFRQQVWLFGGNLMLQRKQKVPGYVDIPKMRSYIYTHGKYREPLTGVSEMEVSYWCYQTKMKLLYLWYHFLENQALPRTVVYGNDQVEANQRASDIASLKSSGVVGLERPSDGAKTFEIIESGGDGGKFFSEAMAFLESWQTHSILAGFLALTGGATGGKGSFALSQDQSSFFLQSRQAISQEIAESVGYDIIRPLVLLNFGTKATFPTLKFGPLEDEQSQAIMTLFGQLNAAPAMHIPLPVFDLITERMASILQLDVDAVHDALTSTANQRAEQLAGNPPPGMPAEAAGAMGALQGMTGAAFGIAQQHGAQGGGLRPPPAPGARAGHPPAPGGVPGQAGQPRIGMPASGPPRPPAKPPMSPPPGKMG